MKFLIQHRTPTVLEYNYLRQQVEWPVYEEQVVQLALANSLYSVVAEHEKGNVIGMGRVLGDNAIYLHIQDVIVKPEYQGKGVGKLIMDALMSYVNGVARKNTNIGLMSSRGREAFYTKYGFISRPTEKFGSGMIKIT